MRHRSQAPLPREPARLGKLGSVNETTRTVTCVALIVAAACVDVGGSSKRPAEAEDPARIQAIDAENAAWKEYVAAKKEERRLWHACDAERAVLLKVRELLGAPGMDWGPEYAARREDVYACERRQPSYMPDGHDPLFPNTPTTKRRQDGVQATADAWLAACAKCAAGGACERRYNEMTRLRDEDVAGYDRPPVCGK